MKSYIISKILHYLFSAVEENNKNPLRIDNDDLDYLNHPHQQFSSNYLL